MVATNLHISALKSTSARRYEEDEFEASLDNTVKTVKNRTGREEKTKQTEAGLASMFPVVPATWKE